MAGDAYITESVSWQIRQTMQRLREWVEYEAARSDINWPDWTWPDWWPDWLWREWAWPKEIGQGLFWLLVAAMATWLAWLLYRALEPSLRRWLAQDKQWITLGKSAALSEEQLSTQHWWQQAQLLAQQGQYREACVLLYRGTLQQLDDAQLLKHDLSRTDSEYLAGLSRVKKSMPRPYQLLIGTHERLTFGRAIASAEMFQRCQRAYQEIIKK